MANIKKIVDKDGNQIHPITTDTAILSEDGKSLNDKYATKEEVPTKTSELINDSDFITNASVDEKIANISIGEEINLSSYAKKTDLPTTTSQLINDSGFIIQIPSEYITETELDAKKLATETYVNNKITEIQLGGDNLKTDIISLNKDVENLVIQASMGRSAVLNDTILPLNFIHFSDIHANQDNWNRIIQYANYYRDYLNFIIHTGDYYNSQDEAVSLYEDGVQPLLPLYNVIGNHDSAINSEMDVSDKQTTFNFIFRNRKGWNVIFMHSTTGQDVTIDSTMATEHVSLAWLNNGYISQNGDIEEYTGWDYTDFIDVSKYTTISFSLLPSGLDEDDVKYCSFYDSTKTFIKTFRCNETQTIPIDAKYIRLSLHTDNASSLTQFEGNYTIEGDIGAKTGYSMTYYKDITASNIRIIVLDLYYNQDIQKTWLESKLNEAKELGYHVITFMHEMSCKVTNKLDTTFQNIEDFDSLPGYNDTEDIYDTIIGNWIRNGGKHIANFAGHEHSDYFGYTDNNVLNIVVECSATDYDNTRYIDVKRVKDTKSYDCFNMVSVNTINGMLKIVRIGNNSDNKLRAKNCVCYDYINKTFISKG